MPSLTPSTRSDEVTGDAMYEGLMNGCFTFVPSLGALHLAMKNQRFVKITNWQSRTALTIMPALFVFAFTAERKLIHRMEEVAQESKQHSKILSSLMSVEEKRQTINNQDCEPHLLELYRKSVLESGVQVVPGNELSLHHKMANFVADNPLKVLASGAVPAVAWIFYGRTGKEHLTFSMKLMHTRVFGQFFTLSLLLGVMGFKEFLDQNGRFITEAEAEARAEEMRQVRQSLHERLELKQREKLQFEQVLQEAHQKDLREGSMATY